MLLTSDAFFAKVRTTSLLVFLAACGGGSSDNATQSSSSPASANSATAASNQSLPQINVSFGGGVGKILHIGYRCNQILEFDVATRLFTEPVKTPTATPTTVYEKGVSRAANGKFSVIELPQRFSNTFILYIFNADGSIAATRKLETGGGTVLAGPVISPDGSTMAWMGLDRVYNENTISYTVFRRIYWFNGQRVLYANIASADSYDAASAGAGQLTWLDSQSIVRAAKDGFYKYDVSKFVDTQDIQQGIKIGGDGAVDPLNPTLSPAGDAIWYSDVKTTAGGSIWKYDLSTQQISEVVKGSLSLGQHFGAFSPDGQWIVFAQANGNKDLPNYVGTNIFSAVSVTSLPVDTAGKDVSLLGVNGEQYGPCLYSRYSWY